MLNEELARWLPEFDRIRFNTPASGQRQIELRIKGTPHGIGAGQLSDGTLFAVALLTLAYLQRPPSFLAIEEPERGVHPRLLRRVQDALYRLTYPDKYGETRPAVQVIATTHSPLLLDLYRPHPEEIVVSERVGTEAHFNRLIDKPNVTELLGTAPLGDLWYTGILGGVPTEG